MPRGHLSHRCCRRQVPADGHAPRAFGQFSMQSSTCCGPAASGACFPRDFPAWGTVYHYFRTWKNTGVWTCVHREIYAQTRVQAGRSECPSVVIMDCQAVKTTERGGVRGFDAHKRVKGRKRHILVDTLGLPIANRVEPASISDRRAG